MIIEDILLRKGGLSVIMLTKQSVLEVLDLILVNVQVLLLSIGNVKTIVR